MNSLNVCSRTVTFLRCFIESVWLFKIINCSLDWHQLWHNNQAGERKNSEQWGFLSGSVHLSVTSNTTFTPKRACRHLTPFPSPGDEFAFVFIYFVRWFFFSGDPFSKSDLIYFLFRVKDIRSWWVFSSIILFYHKKLHHEKCFYHDFFSLGFVHGKILCNREEFCFHSVSHTRRELFFLSSSKCVFFYRFFSFFCFHRRKTKNQGT